MYTVRQWRRRLLAAAGASVAVPALIVVVALVVGVGGGGIAGLGTLSQALTGPELPDAATPNTGAGGEERDDSDPSRLLASVDPVTGPGAAQRRTAARRRAGRERERRGGGGGGGTGERPPATPTPPPQNPPPQDPDPDPPPEDPGPVRQIGNQVKETVEPVPVVGPTAAEVVETLVDTVEELPPAPAPVPLP